MRSAKIIATGSYLPSKILTNFDLEKLVDTNDTWIVERTGINKRHIIASDETSSDMAYHVALQALGRAQINPQQIDLIIVATTTPDAIFPSTACLLQQKLGIKGGAAFDIAAACSGFIYALTTAECYIRAGMAQTVLVVGVDCLSRHVDYTDRGTCILFGDGAGAVIVEASTTPGILSAELRADGDYADILNINASVQNGVIKGNPYIYMDGQAVFKFAVKALSAIAKSVINKAGLSVTDIDWMIPHQANLRIIESTARALGVSMDKVIVTVAGHGNTSAASIPLALDYGVAEGRIKRGDTLLLEGIGAGFTWGAIVIKY